MPGKSYFLGVSRTFSRCMYMCMCVCLHARQINRKLEGKQSGATHQMFTSDRLSGQGLDNVYHLSNDQIDFLEWWYNKSFPGKSK
jgi:hypothetical protein